MAAPLHTTPAEFDDLSRPDAPLAFSISTIEASDCPLAVTQPDGPSLASTLKVPESPNQHLSPKSTQHTFSLSDFTHSDYLDGSGGVEGDSAPADITVAANGNFIETSSGTVARKLKLFYDQRAGVGLTVRSPYTVTGFVSQHGKPMYRVGYRDQVSAPAASAPEVEDSITHSKTPSETSSPHTKRRSRLSMHFLPPAIFTKSNVASTSRPATASSSTSSTSKKLRRARSIPDMFGTEVVVTTAPTFVVTGRGHSQSVTDIPRPSLTFTALARERKIDIFGELMQWFTPSACSSSNFSTHSLFHSGKVTTETDKARAPITHPFGHGVTFKPPSQWLPVNRLHTPRHLREMQSFESGRTARQEASPNDFSDNDSPILSGASETFHELSRYPSAIYLGSLALSAEDLTIVDPAPQDNESDLTLSAESLRLSHYSTEVFNVLQTYRGLPLFEKLVPESEDTTVFRLSLAADQSAAPRDDPRFVLWGEILPDQDVEDFKATSRDSLSNPSLSNTSKRRSAKISRLRSPEASVAKPPVTGQKILLAATIERWIAQLTSDLNYDELLNFFLTYRTYISPVDLCHLLISRFHWALQKHTSREDETVRRIVRVRTFVAIRYWLLTFFTVDFIPNRELRLLIADWLNTLIHDPVLKKHVDGIDIVRRLVKVAKECKRAHTRTAEKPKITSPPKAIPESETPPVDHVLGKSFAKAIRKPHPEVEECDLDLDFLPDEAKSEESTAGLSDPANAHLTLGRAGGSTVLSPSRPTSLPLSSLNILQRMDHAPGPNADAKMPFVQHTPPVPLPARHSALSRAFVKTIGRLGRWKRVLNPRASVRSIPVGPCGAGASAFDIEISAARDLLTMNGGVEQYLQLIEPPIPKAVTPMINAVPLSPLPSALAVHSPIPPMSITPPVPYPSAAQSPISLPSSISNVNPTTITHISKRESLSSTPSSTTLQVSSGATSEVPVDGPPPTFAESEIAADALAPGLPSRRQVSQGSHSSDPDENFESERAKSFGSSSTDSFGAPLTSDGPLPPTFPGRHNPWQFDVASIDDLEFSDTSSIPGEDLTHPPGLRRPPRKLPLRRDFEFVRRSEVSSMGIVSHESMRDSVASSTHSDASLSSSGPKPIQKWQMKSLRKTFDTMSDGEDNGDVEAALRRLEGQINPKVQQEKVQKVDKWLDELNNGPPVSMDTDDDSIFSQEDIDIFDFDTPASRSDTQTLPDTTPNPETEDCDLDQEETREAHTPIPVQTAHPLPAPPGLAPCSQPSLETRHLVEDAVSLEILQSRMLSLDVPGPTMVPFSKFAGPETPRMHRSFIFEYPTELIVEQFAMIDRELFMSIKFEELVTEEWIECEEINVLDWAQYLKDRARWKADRRFPEKTTALAAVRARFNLMVEFVIAEIVLTPPAERDIVVSKFIRMAWKSYSLSNFNTLTAIITALQNEWVLKAMRKTGWNRLSGYETRMFRDLKQFTAIADDFKFMRQAVDSIVDTKPLEGSSQAPSVVSGGGTESQNGKGKASSDHGPTMPTMCIPFVGIYLSQLHRLNKLPALIDPTAPNSLLGVDPITANFDPPAHPEVFSALAPLPESMSLEPLMNVHKQRQIADVIKSLVAGQHLASRVQFEIDKKLFQKCLRLRGLESDQLQRALAVYQ